MADAAAPGLAAPPPTDPSAKQPREEHADNPRLGVAWLVFGLAIMSIQDVIMKLLAGDYAVHQMVFARGLVALPILLVIVRFDGGWGRLRPKRPGWVWLRGLLGLACYTAYYIALAVLPLAEAVTLFFANPLIVTALAAPVLGERVGWRRWGAVLTGFAGVALILQPGARSLEPAMLLGLAAAAFYAASILITRSLSRTEAGSTMAFHMMLVFFLGSIASGLTIGDGRFAADGADGAAGSFDYLLRAWVWPTPWDAALMAATGVIGGIGFYALTQAYRLAPSSSVAPFEFTMLPWALVWGFVFFAETPGAGALAGMALVIGAGLYILRREDAGGAPVVRGPKPWRFRA
ncbi:MAG: DMT family transporter [Alphaproteobacteria bacterium]|nr:DMT family transporter [Alphaproteobacteria bacterium]